MSDMLALLALVFFLSGAAGLVFETLWFRQAGLALGNSFWASSVVLSSYMAGLALGNLLVARWGRRVRDPLATYAALEVLIGIVGVLIVFGLPSLTPMLANLLGPVVDQPLLANPLRLGAAFALLVVPTTAMGATLPLLVRVLVARDVSFGAALGRLYGWNTLGAFVGCLAGEVALIEAFGVRGTSLVAGGANFVAAAGGFWLARRLVATGTASGGAAAKSGGLTGFALRCLLAAALAGGLLLALEVVWFRFLHLFIHAGAVAFAIVLAIVLAGIALGGLLAAAWIRRDPTADRHAASLALVAGVLAVASYVGFQFAVPEGHAYVRSFSGVFWLGSLLMFPSALVSGVLFTFVGSAAQREIGDATRAAGLVTFANTAGAAIGSLVAGFVLLPSLGVEASFALLAGAYAVVALAVWPRSAGERRVPAVPVAAGVILLAALALFPFGLLRNVYLMRAVAFHGTPEQVIAVREGRTETATLMRTEFSGHRLHDLLVTDAYSMAGTALLGRRYMQAFVHLPVALRPAPEQALLISYGVGSTARALVGTRSLERIDVVDISREILGLADLIYSDEGGNPLRDPRVEVHVEDGRHFLQTTDRRYDLITGEPPPPKAAGIESLYTQEYFALVHERLREGGVASYWLPMHSLAETDALAIAGAFCGVFEDCSLWTAAGNQWMLIGSRDGFEVQTEAHFAAQWQDPTVAPVLRENGFERPELLGTTFLADAKQLASLPRTPAPLVDDFPKRLTDGLFTPPGSAVPLTRWGYNTEAAERRFRESAWVRSTWPAGLRERTLASFALQDIVTKTTLRRWRPLQNVAKFHRVLNETDLETLPLWMLGSDADRARIATEVAGGPSDSAGAMLHRGFAALADRRAGDAIDDFAAAHEAEPEDPRNFYWQIYALCVEGRFDDVTRLSAETPEVPPQQEEALLVFWRGIDFVFGYKRPI